MRVASRLHQRLAVVTALVWSARKLDVWHRRDPRRRQLRAHQRRFPETLRDYCAGVTVMRRFSRFDMV